MRAAQRILALTAALCALCGIASARLGLPIFKQQQSHNTQDALSDLITYQTLSTPVLVDHFDVANSQTFDLKYLINEQHYKNGSVLFFYTGNEGNIEGFASNTGIIFDLAKEFNALIVFAEHRYYGSSPSMSYPFGAKSFDSIAHSRYLTVEQALADFEQVITMIRKKYEISKVITFGGSYGGMLSAWFRLSYPHVVDGAWAGSAPVAYFANSNVKVGDFHAVVTRTMETFGCKKESVIKAFDLVRKWPANQYGALNQIFKVSRTSTISSPEHVEMLIGYISEGLEYMAMTGYPYETEFLVKLPRWPMSAACQNLGADPADAKAAANALKMATDAYYGASTQACFVAACGDPATAGLGASGWNYQSCTQMAIDICPRGPPNDVFAPACTAETFKQSLITDCKTMKVVPGWDSSYLRFDAIERRYGLNLDGASNIIMTHGALDPWSAGAPTLPENAAANRQIYTFVIPGAAHHLDLRTPNSCDPPSVTAARSQIVGILKCWLSKEDHCDAETLQSELPKWEPNEETLDASRKCEPRIGAYPWIENAAAMTTSSLAATLVAFIAYAALGVAY